MQEEKRVINRRKISVSQPLPSLISVRYSIELFHISIRKSAIVEKTKKSYFYKNCENN